MIRQLRLVLKAEDQGAYTRYLVIATIYGILQGLAVGLFVPIAEALAQGDTDRAWHWVGWLVVAAAATAIAHYLQAMAGFRVAITVLRTMHLNIGDHLVTLPIGWFDGRTGSVAQVASKGTLAIGSGAAHLMTPVITSVTSPSAVLVVMAFFEWRLALAMAFAAPFIFFASRGAMGLIERSDAITHPAVVESSERVIEFARCQSVLRAFGRSTGGYAPLEAALDRQQVTVRKSLFSALAGQLLNGVVLQMMFSLLVMFAAWLALDGNLSGAELIALLGVLTRFIQPLAELGEFGGAIRLARAELSRVQDIMDTEPLAEPSTSAARTVPGRVEFDQVRFGYDPALPVLNDLSFVLEPNTMTALVGPSGSGKSTVSRLIGRFYDVDAGTVRVGGVDVRDQRTEDLMAQLSMVFQDVYLFDDTLRANVSLGNRDASDAEIERAASLAGVTEIVNRLPAGWDTHVGEGGSALSGGERQRVSIARAMLKGAPIVLLDEATAALDPENERFVSETMSELAESATLLVIAHKLSTVVRADQILVLGDDGRIAERGTHEELLAASGRYAAFWQQRSNAVGWKLVEAG